MEFDNHSPYF